MSTKCDWCGRFMRPGAPGTSWVHVPYTDANPGDERDRCAFCTRYRGPAVCGPQYRRDLCCGRVPEVTGVHTP